MRRRAFVTASREATFLLEGTLVVVDAMNEEFGSFAFRRVRTPTKDFERREATEIVASARALSGRRRW